MRCCVEEDHWGKIINRALVLAQIHGSKFAGMPKWKFCPYCGKEYEDATEKSQDS